MATATMSLTGIIDGTQQTIDAAATLDDATMPYFFAAYRHVYGQVPDTNPDGSPKLDTQGHPVMRDMTDAETFAKYAAGISAGTLANVQSYLREQAAAAAAAAVPTIAVTPT